MSTADRIRNLCLDDDLIGDIARELLKPNPGAPPVQERASLRFTAGRVRQTLAATADALEAR